MALHAASVQTLSYMTRTTVYDQTRHGLHHPPLLHICQELMQLAKLIKADCTRPSLVMDTNDMCNCGKAEVQVPQLQGCLQLHGGQLTIPVLVNCIKPLHSMQTVRCA
jgi:hypothetical protein